MVWEIGSVLRAIRSECRGWHQFRQTAGVWPLCSILAGTLSVPLLFVAGTYCFLAALQTHLLPLIYSTLVVAALSGAAAW